MTDEIKPSSDTESASALATAVGSDRPQPTPPTLEEADKLIQRLFACAMAHMIHQNGSPFSEDWHPTHRDIWNQTLEYKNRRQLTSKSWRSAKSAREEEPS